MTSRAAVLSGILVEFKDPSPLLIAARKTYELGYRHLDAFTPFPVEGLAEAIGFRENKVARLTLFSGLFGGILGFGFQWYANTLGYPMNIGGRPHFSWPAFIPITFEMAVLFAALAAAFGMLQFNDLPKPFHPVFSAPCFDRASRDRYFLFIDATDPLFHLERTRRLIQTFEPLSVTEVFDES